MVNKNKILSDLSKIAVDAMSTFSGLKKEIETLVSLRVNKIINKKVNTNLNGYIIKFVYIKIIKLSISPIIYNSSNTF